MDNSSSTVPAFLTKLWLLVEEEGTDELICWDSSGKSFHVFDQGRFAKDILPLYFKHSNIASFIRQLNMYGFRKVTHVEHGGLKVERDDMEFAHQYFVRGQDHLLEHIKRKISTGKSDDVKVKPDDVHKVLSDVRSMKGKQDNFNSKLDTLKRENEMLWQEVSSLRQKHQKQQQIVNKLIQFLVSMVGTPRGLGHKRKLPLMIQNVQSPPGVSDGVSATKMSRIEDAQLLQPTESTAVPGGLTIYEVMDGSPSSVHAPSPTLPGVMAPQMLIPEVASPVEDEAESTLDSILEAEEHLAHAQQPSYVSAYSAPAPAAANTSTTVINPQQLPTGTATVAQPAGLTINTTTQPVIIPTGLQIALQQPATMGGVPGNQLGGVPSNQQQQLAQILLQQQQQPQQQQQQTEGLNRSVAATSSSSSGPSGGGGGGNTTRGAPTTTTATSLPLVQASSLPSPKIADVTDHLDGMQADLDTLRSMLSGNYSLDANTILGLFNPDGPVPHTPDPAMFFGNLDTLGTLDTLSGITEEAENARPEAEASHTGIMGNELVSYEPSNDTYSTLFDLPDPLLGDDAMGLLSDAPLGLSGPSIGGLHTPEPPVTSPGAAPTLSVTSALANKRKKNTPARHVKKTESLD